MLFTLLLGLSAISIAAVAGYFSVLGIATLFMGSYYQVMIMATALEFGKLIATSYLYRFWTNTVWWLKLYLIIAVITLMGVTSLGIFGYLSSAYQINAGNFQQIQGKIELVEQQKTSIDTELEQIALRTTTLNEARKSQESRLPSMSREAAKPVYADMERAAAEITSLSKRTQELNKLKLEKDNEIIALNTEVYKSKDIGTFRFVAERFNRDIDTVVFGFISVLIAIFDPLAVALILCFNIAVSGRILKNQKETNTAPEFIEPAQPSNVVTKAKRTIPSVGFAVDKTTK